MKEDKRQQKKSWASAQQDVYLELLIVGGVLCTACLLKFSIIFPLFNSLKHSREACLFACFIGCQISPLLPSSVNICKGSKFLTKSTQKKKKRKLSKKQSLSQVSMFFWGILSTLCRWCCIVDVGSHMRIESDVKNIFCRQQKRIISRLTAKLYKRDKDRQRKEACTTREQGW